MGVIGEIVSGELLDSEFRVFNVEALRRIFDEVEAAMPSDKIGVILVKISSIGDEDLFPLLLKGLMRNLKTSIRVPTDFLGRIDSNTFAILLTGIDKKDLSGVASRLMDPLSMKVSIGEKSVASSVNISCSHASELEKEDKSFDNLLELAMKRLEKGQADRGSGIHCG
ncbi:MAG: hypothetical protein PWP37_1334 [Thermotogota bacterium]|nr:hypothetical protein [Thermotogota bacterium]